LKAPQAVEKRGYDLFPVPKYVATDDADVEGQHRRHQRQGLGPRPHSLGQAKAAVAVALDSHEATTQVRTLITLADKGHYLRSWRVHT